MPIEAPEKQERARGIPQLGRSGHDRPPELHAGDGNLRTLQDNSPPPGSTAIWVGIAAISMTFAALTSALVVRQGAGMDWQHLALPNILFLNTLILVASSVTLEMFRRRFAVGDGSIANADDPWLYATFALGALFLAGQYLAWRQLQAEGLFLASNPSSSFFYVLTAAHALHLLGGLGALVYVMRKLQTGILRPITLAVASKYWHFMGVLWIYLLALLWMKL
jgi:cytochrome c oxidase subunit III